MRTRLPIPRILLSSSQYQRAQRRIAKPRRHVVPELVRSSGILAPTRNVPFKSLIERGRGGFGHRDGCRRSCHATLFPELAEFECINRTASSVHRNFFEVQNGRQKSPAIVSAYLRFFGSREELLPSPFSARRACCEMIRSSHSALVFTSSKDEGGKSMSHEVARQCFNARELFSEREFRRLPVSKD